MFYIVSVVSKPSFNIVCAQQLPTLSQYFIIRNDAKVFEIKFNYTNI